MRNLWQGVCEELGALRGAEEEYYACQAPFAPHPPPGESIGGVRGGGEVEGAALAAAGRAVRWRAYELVMGVVLSEPPRGPSKSGARGRGVRALVAPLATKGPASAQFVNALMQIVAARAPAGTAGGASGSGSGRAFAARAVSVPPEQGRSR